MRTTILFKEFTLIVLLVVIAIVAMLLAIVMPGLRTARTTAKRLVSMSNLRQIGIAMTLYADDYAGDFPLTTHTVSDARQTWIYTLSPYLSNVEQIRICPADPQGKERLENNTTSYIMNDYMTPWYRFGQLVADESFHNLHRLRRKDTAITVFVAADRWNAIDAGADHTHSRSWFVSDEAEQRWTAIRADIQPDRYRTGSPNEDNTRGSTLFLYADTGVEVITAEAVKEMSDCNFNFSKPIR